MQEPVRLQAQPLPGLRPRERQVRERQVKVTLHEGVHITQRDALAVDHPLVKFGGRIVDRLPQTHLLLDRRGEAEDVLQPKLMRTHVKILELSDRDRQAMGILPWPRSSRPRRTEEASVPPSGRRRGPRIP